jgi:hypothetical protein
MDIDLADVRPSLWSWIVIGLSAATFIVLMKFVFTKWTVPGLSDIFLAV